MPLAVRQGAAVGRHVLSDVCRLQWGRSRRQTRSGDRALCSWICAPAFGYGIVRQVSAVYQGIPIPWIGPPTQRFRKLTHLQWSRGLK